MTPRHGVQNHAPRAGVLQREIEAYGRFRWLMSYRTFYVWRVRCQYLLYCFRGFRWVSAVLLLALLWSSWLIFRLIHLPVPRVHPEAARLRVAMMGVNALRDIAVARERVGTPTEGLSTREEVRAAIQQSIKVRQIYLGQQSKQLQAHMLADMSDYITVTGVCEPFLCSQVGEMVVRLRMTTESTKVLDDAVRSMLNAPGAGSPAMDGHAERMQFLRTDRFQDVVLQDWVFSELQIMHAEMMLEYRKRAPLPGLWRLLDRPDDPTYLY